MVGEFGQRVLQPPISFLTVQIGGKEHQAHLAPFGQRKSDIDRFFHRDQYDQQLKSSSQFQDENLLDEIDVQTLQHQ